MNRAENSTSVDIQKAEAHQRSGNFRQAEKLFRRIAKSEPSNARAQNALGTILLNQGVPKKAIRFLEAAVRLEPGNARYHYDLGNGLKAANHFKQAIEAFESALRIADSVPEIHNNLGTTLLEIGESDHAESHFERAIELNPAMFQPWLNKGSIYRKQDRFTEAAECFQRAVAINPKSAEAYNNLGHTWLGLNRKEQAIECFERALDLDPDLYEANVNLAYQRDMICDWRDYDARKHFLDNYIQSAWNSGQLPPVTPFQQLARSDDPGLNLQVARAWSRERAAKMSGFALQRRPEISRRTREKIRLGYMSYDFRDHPVGQIAARLFEHHDKGQFDTVAISSGADDGSDIRQKIRDYSSEFIDIRQDSDVTAAQRIYDAEIDILVDLMGFTDGYRMEILALKPAPLQVSYLGYPGTTGAEFMDYLIADATVCPRDQAQYYSETLVHLPDSYMFCPHAARATNSEVSRQQSGLPPDGIVFCCFNQPYKIDPLLFDTWMAILRDIDGSVIWLADTGDTVKTNLRNAAQKAGIDPDRLVFAERVKQLKDHLARLTLADIALDTRLYNGHVTTVDAIFAGVPVITVAGNHFPSRVAASVLRAAGAPDLIANDLPRYCELATELASDCAKLGRIRKQFAENRAGRPLFDVQRYVFDIERAYRKMWERFQMGEAPQEIALAPLS